MKKVQPTNINGLFVIQQEINSDLRGNFLELYKKEEFKEKNHQLKVD